MCMCSNSCNYAKLSNQMVDGSDILIIKNGDCQSNTDPASGKTNDTCTPSNLRNESYYCVFDNVADQTVADVLGATTTTPSRTKATYECTTGYEKPVGALSHMECQY